MEKDKEKFITFKQNPNIDFLFGYFGAMNVPTKQDGYKPINAIQIDNDGVETILKHFYQRKPETASVQKFEDPDMHIVNLMIVTSITIILYFFKNAYFYVYLDYEKSTLKTLIQEQENKLKNIKNK